MKFLFTLIFLFLSLPLYADDDLSNKSIICGEIRNNKIVQVEGYKFITNEDAEIYFYSNLTGEVKKVIAQGFKYQTSLKKIKIKEVLSLEHNYLSKKYTEIDRATLEVTCCDDNENNRNIIFEGNTNNCEVYGSENMYLIIKKIYKRLEKELTKNNKI